MQSEAEVIGPGGGGESVWENKNFVRALKGGFLLA